MIASWGHSTQFTLSEPIGGAIGGSRPAAAFAQPHAELTPLRADPLDVRGLSTPAPVSNERVGDVQCPLPLVACARLIAGAPEGVTEVAADLQREFVTIRALDLRLPDLERCLEKRDRPAFLDRPRRIDLIIQSPLVVAKPADRIQHAGAVWLAGHGDSHEPIDFVEVAATLEQEIPEVIGRERMGRVTPKGQPVELERVAPPLVEEHAAQLVGKLCPRARDHFAGQRTRA